MRFSGQGMMSHTASTTISRYFTKSRGRALSMIWFGLSSAEFILPVLIVYSLTLMAWQNIWIIISENKNISHEIEKQCPGSDFAITDLSHSRAIIEVRGNDALNVIKKGSPLNLNNFVKNNCANSVYHGITISVDMIDDDPITLNIMASRSFAGSFYHAITDASLEFGFKTI